MFGDFMRSMTEDGGMDLSLAQTVIDGPAIQVLPLAIYLLCDQVFLRTA